jgi:hypothetical protein
MIPAPNRRWFSFSLRTLFVAVMVWCWWLGYELNWIRARHAALRFPNVESDQSVGDDSDPFGNTTHYRSAPALLWLFGEPGHATINLLQVVADVDLSPADEKLVKQLMALFPEAEIGVVMPPPESEFPEAPRQPPRPKRPWSDFDGFKL